MYSPDYTITNSILSDIGRIDAAKALIDSSPLLPSWEKKFQEEAVARTVHHGTHLEGNELNFTEAKRVIEGEQIVARERDIREVINYRNVIEFIGDSDNPTINEELVKQLHRLTTEQILPPHQTGVYRNKTVVVRNSLTGEISFRPPPAVEVPFLTRDLLAWLQDNNTHIHPVLKAGIAQYEFVRIHPFTDGNGRVARALCMLVLYKHGYDIRRFFSLEEYYDKNAKEYYAALQNVTLSTPAQRRRQIAESEQSFGAIGSDGKSDRGPQKSGRRIPRTADSRYDLTPWLEYFVEGLAIEFNRIKEKIRKVSRDLNFQHSLGGQIFLNERQLKIIEHIQETGSLQNRMFSRLFPDLSDDTVLRELKDLMKKNIIKKRGKTKAARYVLS